MDNKKNTPAFFHGEAPEGWEVKKLGDICEIYVGKDLKEDNFSMTKTHIYQYPVYSNTVQNEGLYGYYNIEEYSGESLTVVGRGAGLGMAFTRNGSYGAIGRLLILFPKNGNCAHYITEYINNQLNIHQESGGIPQLTSEQIAGYKITIPNNEEQRAIAACLGAWDEAIQKKQPTHRTKRTPQKMADATVAK